MAKDFATPVLLGLTLIMFIVTAATPFAQKTVGEASLKFSFFQACQSFGSTSQCQAVTPSTEFACTDLKNLWLGSQAMVLLTIFATVLLALLAIARLGDKCMNFNGKVLLVFHVLMLIFGLVCTCVAAALYWAPRCGTDISASSELSIGPAFPCALVGFLFGCAATAVSRKYFGSEGASDYQAY